MAHCPVCASEFPPGSRCPQHGALVDVLPGVRGTAPGDDRFVRVATVWSEAMAQSWAELLRNNSIPALVKTGGPGFSFGAPPPFGYETYIHVPQTSVGRARDLLEAYEGPGVLQLDPNGNA